MTRDIDFTKKLSKDDVDYLLERHSVEYVNRMVELAGGVKSGKGSSEADEAAERAKAEKEAREAAEEAARKQAEADLIGSVDFDPLKATEAEIKTHLDNFEPTKVEDERARIHKVESERGDREPRKGVLAL